MMKPTPFTNKWELLIALLSVPAVQTPFIHAFNLKALKLGTEDIVLRKRGIGNGGNALGRQKHLHGP